MQKDSLAVEDEVISDNKYLLNEYVLRWGGAIANAMLEPACKAFTTPGIEGFIGYRDENKCIVVYGDPVCAPNDVALLATRFHEYCTSLEKTIVFIATLKPFTEWALNNICKIGIEFGSELRVNPQNDPKVCTGSSAQVMRSKVRQAERTGITIHEYEGNDPKIEKQLEDTAKIWLKSRKGPQIYIAHIDLFDDRKGKRWLYAAKDDKVVGFVILAQLEKHKGWLLSRLIAAQAPNGTSELLVISAIETLREEGCEFLSFGAAPAIQLGEIKGLGNITTFLARKGYRFAYRFFNLEGRRKFWEKYCPQSEPCYLMFSDSIGMKELTGLSKALNISM